MPSSLTRTRNDVAGTRTRNDVAGFGSDGKGDFMDDWKLSPRKDETTDDNNCHIGILAP